MLIKERIGKVSKRGLYIQDRELKESLFKPGTQFTYDINFETKQITILPASDDSQNTVSKRQLKDGVKPVLDLRSKEVLKLFATVSQLKIFIYEDKIIVLGLDSSNENLFTYETDFESLDIDKDNLNSPEIPLKILSLFSGAGCLDYGFIKEGFEVQVAIEIDSEACETYKANIGDHVLNKDINDVDFTTLEPCDIVIGGSPCQDFSPENQKTRYKTENNEKVRYLDSPKNKLVLKFIEAVQKTNAKVFLLENVPDMLKAGGGLYLKEIQERLSNYNIRFGELISSHFNSAQKRKRAFVIGTRADLNMTINLPEGDPNSARTVGEVFQGIHDELPNQLDYSKARKDTIERMKHVPMGGNFRYIPDELKPSGKHSIMFRRLHWDETTPTLPNVRKASITHPFFHRILSIREVARLFDLDDSFIFKGKLSSRQQQIANAVPVNMVRAIAKEIKNAFLKMKSSLLTTFICCIKP
ncbi:DNA cytosine methyltransferase [Gottfriedia solisilvae]|uniref:DNA cytosine methyltransferase n=1 Tax=Gottfriedia solisilvae TaxID=1516104 RepID=UPI003D2EEB8B